ncbi:MAG: histidine kinase dimerization/phospho-acceptor domain-containing protein [candidate division Zixibacteria bacterium]
MLETATTKTLPVSEELLWGALDGLDVGIFVLNRDGYLVRYNDTAARVFGLSHDAGWGENDFSNIDFVMSLGLVDRIDEIVNKNDSFCRKGIRCTNPNGEFHILDMCCNPAQNSSGEVVILGTVRDVRNDRQTEDPDRYPQLRILSTVAASLSSSSGLNEILEVILTGATASQGLGFNRAFLFLYDQQSNSLTGHQAVGPSSAEEAGHIWRELESKNLSLDELLDGERRQSAAQTSSINSLIKDMKHDLNGDSLIGRACSSGTWLNLEAKDEIDADTALFLDRLGTRRMALVPMVSTGNLMGLLAADCAITGRSISDASVQLLQILANQAAVAMERARLYEDQLTRATQLEDMNRLLGESQDHIIKIEKMSIIGELTAAIAHELRNPLAVIGGFANLMHKSEMSDEQREYLNIIASETARSESVLTHVMDFHEASKSDRRTIDFSDLVHKNLKLAKGRLRRPDIAISMSLSPQEMTIYGNYDQLSHAFYQFFRLVAEDLIPPGEAEVRTEKDGEQAVMIIRIDVSGNDRMRTVKAMRQIFSDNKTSQRLTVLVAGETIRYHGGNFGICCNEGSEPSLYVQLPLSKEG